ncbi:DUF4062 domain-containing protein [Chitinophaga tropicalis]|uniref:DUF4062 domain-containing protein n=1 Tax=Chitinophaga tropicalis TaxID=2683588 RepID=A0A7K1U7F4_9BACT|nr:DUF4062 domain-containing protein [Chitinophaga tropicalis]MVT10287.1 DUF4062 domain-containing protein [Chitinophaga tropicalis]
MPGYTVYLSSTFLDLKAYREEVNTLFKNLPGEFALVRMETYNARNMQTLEACLTDVKQCDIYILLVGNRYGFIPEDEQKNPEGKSITELEYETAMKFESKMKFLFLIDENSTNIEDDDQEEKIRLNKKNLLKEFRKKVSHNLSSPIPVKEPQELVLKISSTLISWLNSKTVTDKKILDERWKYCCDRSVQYASYEIGRIQHNSNFHVFISHGNKDDLGSNLVNRCTIFSLQLHEKDIFSISLNEIYQGDYEISKQRFLQQLQLKLPAINKLFSQTYELPQSDTKNLGVYLLNCPERFLDEKKIDFLVRFFEEMYNKYKESAFLYQIYLFVNIEDQHEHGEDSGIVTTLKSLMGTSYSKDKSHPYISCLPRFGLASQELIKIWIREYITSDQGQLEDLFEAHFEALPEEFRMRIAEKSIREFYRRINNNDYSIMNIINS